MSWCVAVAVVSFLCAFWVNMGFFFFCFFLLFFSSSLYRGGFGLSSKLCVRGLGRRLEEARGPTRSISSHNRACGLTLFFPP
ncbi:hypothetical protein BDN72DRAFT_559127 [Pluteus cervinus]|uniref:Uncharacterized protein n=1 Tax=Pluteus cervinus TaxID=181527 RepID=A0ACD3BBU9_9AGAR|nr:hypothetical protein BDN72DRAFT_559127 [Pluteus cervinus]